MRRWQNLAAPDDPGSWYDVDGFLPSDKGTYGSQYGHSSATSTATGAGTVLYAHVAEALSSTLTFVVAGKIFSYADGSSSDITNGVTIGSYPMMAQYGNVTICAMGAGAATVASISAGNFSALAGAPNGEIVVIQSNCVLIFNTSANVDGWAASDVGDYTNWTTGEAASGRLIATPGPITAAVAFGDSVIVFKSGSTYRMRYVGGAVKWVIELIHSTLGCGTNTNAYQDKYSAAASHGGVLFLTRGRQQPNPSQRNGKDYYWLNGSGQFELVNPLTKLGPTSGVPMIRYAAEDDAFSICGQSAANAMWFWSPVSRNWGASSVTGIPSGGTQAFGNAGSNRGIQPVAFYKSNNNELTRYTPSAGTATSQSIYLQTSMTGKPNRKTKFLRLIPILHARSATVALSVDRYRELHDASPANTDAVTESTQRKRFDMALTDNFARFKVTFSGSPSVEVDDFLIDAADAGRD